MRHRTIIARYTIGLCALASAAHAEPSQSDRARARELMAAGRTQRSASHLQEALTSFSAANDIMHVPSTLFEVAATQSALGQLLAARSTLKELARLPAEADEPAAFRNARHAGYELASSIEQRIPALDVSIEGQFTSQDTALSIDGHPSVKGQEFSHIELDPGKHRLIATSGNSKAEASVSLEEGGTQRAQILLDAPVDAARALNPNAGASPAADHRSGAPARGESVPWAVYSLGGLGLAGLGVGVGFFAEAKHVKSSLQASCAPLCTTEQANGVHH